MRVRPPEHLRPFYEVTLNLAGLLPSQDWTGLQEAFGGRGACYQRLGLTAERWSGDRRLPLGTRADLTAAGPPHARQLHAAFLPSSNYSPEMGRGWIRPPASIGCPGPGPAHPCGKASHWPGRRPARFRCAHWLPLSDPRRGRRGGPQDWWSRRTMAAPVQPAASWAPSGVPSAVPAIRAAIASALCVRPGATHPRPPSPLR